MSTKPKYNPIVEAEVYLEEGVFVTLADGTQFDFSIDDYLSWLIETQDLEEYMIDKGEWYDEGEGYTIPALSIDWYNAIEHFKSLELVKKFYKSLGNLVLS